MPRFNTHVAALRGTARGDVCTATVAAFTVVGAHVGLPAETSLVLIFETGHNRPSDDTDDQKTCAFIANESVAVAVKNAAAQHARYEFPLLATALDLAVTFKQFDALGQLLAVRLVDIALRWPKHPTGDTLYAMLEHRAVMNGHQRF